MLFPMIFTSFVNAFLINYFLQKISSTSYQHFSPVFYGFIGDNLKYTQRYTYLMGDFLESLLCYQLNYLT